MSRDDSDFETPPPYISDEDYTPPRKTEKKKKKKKEKGKRRVRAEDLILDDDEDDFEPVNKRTATLLIDDDEDESVNKRAPILLTDDDHDDDIALPMVEAAAIINTAAEENKPVPVGSVVELANQFEEAQRIRMVIKADELQKLAEEKHERNRNKIVMPQLENHENTLARILIFLQTKRKECEGLTSQSKKQKYLALFDRLIARVQKSIQHPLWDVKDPFPPLTKTHTPYSFQGPDYHELRHMVPKTPKTMLERRIKRFEGPPEYEDLYPHDFEPGNRTSPDVAKIVEKLSMGGPLDYRIPINNTPATQRLRHGSKYGELVTERDLKNIRDEAEADGLLYAAAERDGVRFRQALAYKQRKGAESNKHYPYALNNREIAERFIDLLNDKVTEWGATNISFYMFGDTNLENLVDNAERGFGIYDRYVYYVETDVDPVRHDPHAITIVIDGLIHLEKDKEGHPKTLLKPTIFVLDSSGYAYSIDSLCEQLARQARHERYNKRNAKFLRKHQDMFHWEFPRNVVHQFGEIYDGDCFFFTLWNCLWLAMNPSIPVPLPPPPPYQNMEMFRRYIMLCLKENMIVDSDVIRKFTGGKKIRKI